MSSKRSLEQMKTESRFIALTEAVREALRVGRALQEQGKQGFSEVTVRNPKTGEERVLVIPDLVGHAASSVPRRAPERL